MKFATVTAAILLPLGFASSASAAVLPTSYDTPNGYTGSYRYWDLNYTGAGNTTVDGAALTGGLGDLTDGVLANDHWFNVENNAGTGPYLGWTIDPTIAFHFTPGTVLSALTVFFDDANGAGGVSIASSVDVTVNGVTTNYGITDPASDLASSPFTVALGGVSTDLVTLKINRSNTWVFVSEVTFDGRATGAVPEPATWAMMLIGFGLVGSALRGRRTAVLA